MTGVTSYSKSILMTFAWSLLFGALCLGQSVKGPFSKYEKGDYESAEEGFRNVLCDYPDDVFANLGMGLLCSNNSILLIPTLKDKYDLLQAFRHIRKSKKGVDRKTDAELVEMNKTIKTIPDVKDKVYKEFDKIEVKLHDQIMSRMNLDSANVFVNEFPYSKYYTQVLQVRNNLYFNKVKGTEDVKALNDFIERCPGADSIPAAIYLRNLAAYNALMNETRSLDAVYDYLNRYPNSKQYPLVIGLRDNLEYEEAQKAGTYDAYFFFFENFPKASQAPLLRNKYIELSYQEARRQNTIASYTEFLDRFPLAKSYAQSARNDRDSLCFQLFSGTVDSLNKFITFFPFSQFYDVAIRLRDKKAFEKAKQDNETKSWEQFIYNYPAAQEINLALAARDSIVLEYIRYMFTEKAFSDFLADYPYLINQPKTREYLEAVLYQEAKKLDEYDFYQQFLDRCPTSKHIKEIEDLKNKKEKSAAK